MQQKITFEHPQYRANADLAGKRACFDISSKSTTERGVSHSFPYTVVNSVIQGDISIPRNCPLDRPRIIDNSGSIAH